MSHMQRPRTSQSVAWGTGVALVLFIAIAIASTQTPGDDGSEWVERTLASMSLEERVGQLVVPSFNAVFTSTTSEAFEELVALVRDHHVGGVHVFGGRQRVPAVRLNPTYARVTLGDALVAATTLNLLQREAAVPLLGSADFESGVGFRMRGATLFPRAMAFGATDDESLAYEAGRITAVEGRALGVQVNFAPVVDVNNNPRNPVINTRSYGASPELVSRLASAYIRGLQQGGMIATAKHFPGHGDTDVDTHLGLARVPHPRERWERVEWAPFRASIDAGVGALMTGHVEVPALDPREATPASFSRPAVEEFLRGTAGFAGLVYTDSMSMRAVMDLLSPGEAAVRALDAGNDIILHSPDPVAAIEAIRGAVARGEISAERLEASVRRVLHAKARLRLHQERLVDLEQIPALLGGREHRAVAATVAERAVTLVRDARNQVPLPAGRDASVLYLSVLDYPSNWGIGAPSRAFIPELQRRWPRVTAIEVSDRTSPTDLDMVQDEVSRHDVVIAGVFVRAASGSGRMDLAAPLVELLQEVADRTADSGQPFVTVLLGNPYIASALPRVPALLLTYDYSEHAEVAAVRALAGEAAIRGRLPIVLPDIGEVGEGLSRPGPGR